jgi:signal transduction histidine kinase/ligand-binding sensor domain-containing protein
MVSRYLRPLAIVAMLHAGSRYQLVYAHTQALRAMDHSMWTANDGAPQTITHLAQDPNGTLWIGGESGLFNFDGVTFRPFESPPGEPKLPAGEIRSLLMTKAGTLWVAFNKVGLARAAAGRVTLYDMVDAKPLGLVTQLREAPEGSIWAVDSHGQLLRFGTDGTWRTEPVPTSASIAGMFVDSANTLWLAQDGFLYRRALPQTSYVRTNVHADVITGFAETPNGDIWMNDYDATTSQGRTQQIDPTGHVSRTHAQGLPESGTIVATADGSLIVTSVAAGLRRMSSNEVSWPPSVRGNAEPDIITRALGLSTDATRAVLVDADGNIWIGGLRGLDLLRPVRFPRYLSEVKTDAWGLCATTRGDMWAANAVGEVYSVSGPVATRLHGGGDPLISLACADVGRAWFVNSSGVWSIEAGRVAPLPPIAGARPRALIKIVAASDSTLYAMVTGALEDGGGVWRYGGGRWTRLQRDDEFGGDGYSAYVDRRDRLWIGHAEGRAVLHSANNEQVLSSGDPGLGYVHAFLDTSHGLFAVGTNGLAVLQDFRFKMLTYAEPSLVRGVRGMVEAPNGDLWLNSANGFAHVPANELEAGIGNPTYPMKVGLVRDGNFGHAGGPHSVISYLDTAARDSQGQLWFATRSATHSDLVRLNPESNDTASHAPRLTIRSIVADGRPLSNNRILTPATRMVDIQYFGVNLTAPESVVYRYRLEGFDQSWLDADRRTEAVYTNLPPGTYTFHVIASSSDGVWTTPLSSAPFTVLPHFYRTGWFAAAMAALVALVVGIVHAARVRYISRQMHARFDERLGERTRIARELHDTLLQTVHGSKLVADRALRDAADRDRLVQALKQLSMWLGQAAAEGRAALQSMRASTTESNDLAGAFRRAANECRNNSSAEIPFSVQGRARELHPAVRDEVYRIGFEAIRNACAHSGASRIDVALEYGRDLTLRISDNGSGIDGAVVETGKEGHFGLRGMRERAERIGAAFTLVSVPDTGTAITLIVPGRLAFLPLGRGAATQDRPDQRSSEYL